MHQTTHEFPLLKSDAWKIERLKPRFWRKENDKYVISVSEDTVSFLQSMRISKDLYEMLLIALSQDVGELML